MVPPNNGLLPREEPMNVAKQGRYKEGSPGGKGFSRRSVLKAPLALGATYLAGGSSLLVADQAMADGSDRARIFPQYFPLRHFEPELSLAGKLAVMTGASRGNGRAVAEALL